MESRARRGTGRRRLCVTRSMQTSAHVSAEVLDTPLLPVLFLVEPSCCETESWRHWCFMHMLRLRHYLRKTEQTPEQTPQHLRFSRRGKLPRFSQRVLRILKDLRRCFNYITANRRILPPTGVFKAHLHEMGIITPMSLFHSALLQVFFLS